MSSKDNLILLDMDGVLVDVQSAIHIPSLNEKFETDYALDDFVRFDYFKYMPHYHAEHMIQTWRNEDLYDRALPEPGAMKGVEKLRKLGRVIVVSSPMDGHATSKSRWLTRHGFPREDRVLATDKTLIEQSGALLIDDGPFFLQAHTGPKICFDRPWNRHLNGIPDMVRAATWFEIPSLAEEILS